MNFKIKPPQDALLHREGVFVNMTSMGENTVLRSHNSLNGITTVFVNDSDDRVLSASRNGRLQTLIMVCFVTGQGVTLTASYGIASPVTAGKPFFRSAVESVPDGSNQIAYGNRTGLFHKKSRSQKYIAVDNSSCLHLLGKKLPIKRPIHYITFT